MIPDCRTSWIPVVLFTFGVVFTAVGEEGVRSRSDRMDEVLTILERERGPLQEAAIEQETLSLLVQTVDRGGRCLTTDEWADLQNIRSGILADGTLLPSIKGRHVWGETWYVRLNGIYAHDAAAMREEWIAGLSTGGYTSLIIDLRGAGGAGVQTAADLAALFAAPSAPMGRIEYVKGGVAAEYAGSEAVPFSQPIILLTDTHTTGAAELMAAMMLGSQASALIMGQSTCGDMALRTAVEMKPYYLYFTDRKFISTSGTTYDGKIGVEPHIQVEAPVSSEIVEPSADPVVRRARDVLSGIMALKKEA